METKLLKFRIQSSCYILARPASWNSNNLFWKGQSVCLTENKLTYMLLFKTHLHTVFVQMDVIYLKLSSKSSPQIVSNTFFSFTRERENAYPPTPWPRDIFAVWWIIISWNFSACCTAPKPNACVYFQNWAECLDCRIMYLNKEYYFHISTAIYFHSRFLVSFWGFLINFFVTVVIKDSP